MTIEIKAPTFPESVQDGSIATWHKKPGEAVSRDELIVDIETDKVVLEVVAPADGSLSEILKEEGDTVLSNEVIAKFEEGEAGAKSEAKDEAAEEKKSDEKSESKPADGGDQATSGDEGEKLLSPAARKMADENDIDPNSVPGTGKDGRVTKEDVANFLKSGGSKTASEPGSAPAKAAEVEAPAGDRAEKRVPMTRLRKRIAERLLEASNTTAMLTTFNEVNMGPIMELRAKYKDQFEKSHDGTRLGFMGFFVKAAAEALRRFPAVNASIDNNDIVYHGYQDIGVAVSTDKGLVVPVLRNAENMGLADIESTIRDYGLRARDGKLGIEEMTGGTFTITNGGVFGSLLSTPILNLPQSAILGMHKIQERPMAVNGEVKILPMMYLALSYDHRLLDGKEAVQFLVTIKDLLEDPARILLEI
ncbi:2-oxoglutarate dehydrogenase complex dihydrolipoyllysine-residue succinyltransferase [Marinimicrobium sp. C6131]|uniref:2-oxoglutarate dehydrogenase complex dihydrolipoyllysine-residue succinyltransferase n=1 Tax=Marinimicrobium sp. C6131 TaxID=3022676 RepID=UPI00223DFB23|nr:2-oxoglutarate dehydrogenase complex dihydrolipoyllysine-residue succinyltransferase [Marinimicrobium sp. C6131]UZJ45726.1 2-oxoglutarate dehydrogenase complex dihydrolipoyllysine-residue succinyltransferase [Marinimicrobium sp. C6131]